MDIKKFFSLFFPISLLRLQWWRHCGLICHLRRTWFIPISLCVHKVETRFVQRKAQFILLSKTFCHKEPLDGSHSTWNFLPLAKNLVPHQGYETSDVMRTWRQKISSYYIRVKTQHVVATSLRTEQNAAKSTKGPDALAVVQRLRWSPHLRAIQVRVPLMR